MSFHRLGEEGDLVTGALRPYEARPRRDGGDLPLPERRVGRDVFGPGVRGGADGATPQGATRGREVKGIMLRRIAIVVVLLALAGTAVLIGCVTRAVISDLEEDKVVVDATGRDRNVIDAEATKGCAIHGRLPVPISSRCLDEYCIRSAYLYACKAAH